MKLGTAVSYDHEREVAMATINTAADARAGSWARALFMAILMRMGRLAPLLLLPATGCLSAGRSHFMNDHGTCVPDPALVGTWESARKSQLGPAKMTMTLRCDCSYTVRVGLLFTVVHERGEYRVRHDEIVFSRATGDVAWPFTLEDGRLLLTEFEGEDDETHAYTRVGEVKACRP